MKVTFYLRGSVIQSRISDGAKINYRFSTGIKVPGYLKFDNGQFIGNSPEIQGLNNDLTRHKFILTDLYLTHKDYEKIKNFYNALVTEKPVEEEFEEGSYDILSLAKEYLRLATRGDVKSKKHKPLTPSSINVYRNVINTFAEFCYIHGSIDIREFEIHHTMDVMKRKSIQKRFNDYFSSFDKYMISHELIHNTRSSYLTVIGTVLGYWKKEFLLQLPTYRFEAVKSNPIVTLDPEFVSEFYNDMDTYNKLNDRMKVVWEVCATILVTTLRLNDAISLKWENFVVQKDKMLLNKLNKKTHAETMVLMPPNLSRIFMENMSKHNSIWSYKPNRDIVTSNIKHLFSMYPQMHKIVTVWKFGLNGEEISKTLPFFEAVHPHLLRKTAITTMLASGMKDRHVKFASGHSSSSNSFERYVGFVEKVFNKERENYFKSVLMD